MGPKRGFFGISQHFPHSFLPFPPISPQFLVRWANVGVILWGKFLKINFEFTYQKRRFWGRNFLGDMVQYLQNKSAMEAEVLS